MKPASSIQVKQENPKISRWVMALTILAALLGFGITSQLAWSHYRAEKIRLEEQFQRTSKEVFTRTLREIQLFMEVLDSIRQLHTLSSQISETDFAEFVRKGMLYQRRILRAYGFSQQIPNEIRASFEEEGNPIVWGDGRGRFAPVLPKAEYFPLTYQTPPGGLGVPDGYDFSIRPEDAAAIQSMSKTGIFALGGSVLSDVSNERNIFMFAPIFYDAPQTTRYLAGFAIGLFSPDRILKTASEQQPNGIQFRLLPSTEFTSAITSASTDHWQFSSEFTLAQQYWTFVADVPATQWELQRSRMPEWIAVSGGGITFALLIFLLLMEGQARRIEMQVKVRTSELSTANRKLADVMEERRQLENEILQISDREKARIGRDLHDSLGQKLTGVLYLFGAFRRQMESITPENDEQAEQITSTLRDAVTQIRRIARGLAPVELTEDGLPDALRNLAEESSTLFQKSIEFFAEREGRPKQTGASEHLFLIVQEAIHNAIRHGLASRVVITLDYEGSEGFLTIEDNGNGFKPKPASDKEGGNGLRIMHHRVEVFGGTISIEKNATGGITVACRFPAA